MSPFINRQFSLLQPKPQLVPPGEYVPHNTIPATGRGNSEDGSAWLNPSASQLYRAMKRRDKPIEQSNDDAVAHVHELSVFNSRVYCQSCRHMHSRVTSNTWEAIMQYEALHHACVPRLIIIPSHHVKQPSSECPTPRLTRFRGMDGIYSPKARILNLFGFASCALLSLLTRTQRQPAL